MTNTKKTIFILVVVLMAVITSFLLAQYTSCLKNTLMAHPQWIETKDSLEKQVSLAYAFKHKRTALSRNHLNLGAWNGYNEVFYKDAVDLSQINFRVYWAPESYLVFLFNKSDQGCEGIRLSAHYLFPNIYFKANKMGEFLDVQPLSPFHVEPHAWKNVQITSEAGKINVYLNGHLTYALDAELHHPSVIGFRGGQHDVMIDDIAMQMRQPSKTIKEDFRNKTVYDRVFFFCLCAACCLMVFLLRWKNLNAKGMFSFLYFGVLCLLVLVALNVFDYFYCVRYPKVEGKLKEMEENWVAQEEGNIKKDVAAFYMKDASENTYRILFLGSSQTWGSGATQKEDVFVHQVEKNLNHVSEDTDFQCINGAISGTTASRLFFLYKNEFVRVHPQMVVINLSNNDNQYDEREFVQYLEKFIEYNIEHDIRTVFVLEPNSLEHRYLLPLHGPMRDVAKAYGTPVIDLHDYLRRKYDTGFLWWDSVHMSSYGHTLSAGWISSKLFEIINNTR